MGWRRPPWDAFEPRRDTGYEERMREPRLAAQDQRAAMPFAARSAHRERQHNDASSGRWRELTIMVNGVLTIAHPGGALWSRTWRKAAWSATSAAAFIMTTSWSATSSSTR